MTRDANPSTLEPLHVEDLDLVHGTLQGTTECEHRFLERMKCVPRIVAATNRRFGTPVHSQDLADLTQDILIVIWRKLGEFEGRSSLETWIYRVCCLELMNRIRKRDRRGVALELNDSDAATETAEPDLDRPRDFERLYQGLDQLESEESDVIRLKHFRELTFREIGDRLGVSANTAKTRYYRGIKTLWRQLRDPGESVR